LSHLLDDTERMAALTAFVAAGKKKKKKEDPVRERKLTDRGYHEAYVEAARHAGGGGGTKGEGQACYGGTRERKSLKKKGLLPARFTQRQQQGKRTNSCLSYPAGEKAP